MWSTLNFMKEDLFWLWEKAEKNLDSVKSAILQGVSLS